MAQPLSAFESGSTIEKRHRRGPRPSKNSSGGFTKQSEDPIAFGDWHPSLEEAMQQAVRFRMERDAAILDRQHAFDALRDLQAASARSADGSGIGTAHHVPPSAFTAELLRKDALIEQASREFSQLSASESETTLIRLQLTCAALQSFSPPRETFEPQK